MKDRVLWKAFNGQMSAARRRGIEFPMTYAEWLGVWQASGKLEQRGRLRDQYVMARFGDKGPYAIDNVYILSLIHISEPTRLLSISYAVFCLKKKTDTSRFS